jgi:hypothetical protein
MIAIEGAVVGRREVAEEIMGKTVDGDQGRFKTRNLQGDPCRRPAAGVPRLASPARRRWSESTSEIGDQIEKEIGVMDLMFRHDESFILALSPISPR